MDEIDILDVEHSEVVTEQDLLKIGDIIAEESSPEVKGVMF